MGTCKSLKITSKHKCVVYHNGLHKLDKRLIASLGSLPRCGQIAFGADFTGAFPPPFGFARWSLWFERP